MTRRTDRRRRRPAAHRPRAAPRPRRASGRTPVLLVVRRRVASPTRRPTPGRPSWRGRCSPPARARAPTSPSSTQRRRLRRRVAGRGPHRRGQRPAEHLLDRRRAGGPAARRRRRRPAGAVGYRSHDYADTLAAAVRRSTSLPPPLLAPSVPTLRSIWFRAGDRGHPGWTLRRCSSRPAVDADVLAAAEAAVTPADRMVIVHTSGSTSEPKGVIHGHGVADPPPRQPQRAPAAHRRRGAVRQLAVLLDRRVRLLAARHAGRWRPASCARTSPNAAGVLDVLERERPTMVNGFAQSVAHLPDDPTFAGRDLSSIRRGNLFPILPAGVRPGRPRAAPLDARHDRGRAACACSSDDEVRPARAPRGSFGRPAPGFETRVVDPDTGACAVGRVGELSFRGPFLMEGYDGRERHETFDADGWYRHRRPRRGRRRRLLLLPGPAQAT